MITLSCPSCGAELKFLSKASVFAVCSFCKSTVVRHDMDLDLLGKMGELQDELTPLQVGTAGTYESAGFDVIGRLRVGYEDGFWNEWYCMFSDGRLGWLAQAQGFYAMCFPVGETEQDGKKIPGRFSGSFPEPGGGLPPAANVSPGMRIMLQPYGQFLVDDIHDVECKYSEGELPMNAAKGRKSKSVDLRGPLEQMATIEYASDCVRAYVGKYVDFDDFKFKHLREIDGW